MSHWKRVMLVVLGGCCLACWASADGDQVSRSKEVAIVVHPDGSVVPDRAEVGRSQEAHWYSLDGSPLDVEFEESAVDKGQSCGKEGHCSATVRQGARAKAYKYRVRIHGKLGPDPYLIVKDGG